MTFIVALFVPHVTFFCFLGKVVLRDCGILCIFSLTVDSRYQEFAYIE